MGTIATSHLGAHNQKNKKIDTWQCFKWSLHLVFKNKPTNQSKQTQGNYVGNEKKTQNNKILNVVIIKHLSTQLSKLSQSF